MSEEQLKKWNEVVVELIGWNYGTIYKGYDEEETTKVLEEDTRKYIDQLLEIAKSRQIKD